MSLPAELQSVATAAKKTLEASVVAFIKQTFEDAIAQLAKSISESAQFSFPDKRAWMTTLEAMFSLANVYVAFGHHKICPKFRYCYDCCRCTPAGTVTYVIQRRTPTIKES